MTFTQIEYFVEAARCGNLTRAAEKLFVTQQAVSKQIQSMEQEVGFSLFVRNHKGIELTPAGEVCMQAWEQMLEQHQSVLRQARKLAKETKIPLRVGISEFTGIWSCMIPVLEEYAEKYDNMDCIYEVDNVVNLCRKMNQGKLDLLVSLESEFEEEGYQSLLLAPLDFQVGVALGRNHPLADRKKLGLKDLKQERILLLKDSYSKEAAGRVLNYFKRERFKPNEIEYFDNVNALELALSTGKGVTIAYNLILQGINSHLKFYPLDIAREDYWMWLAVAWNREENRGFAEELVSLQKQMQENGKKK